MALECLWTLGLYPFFDPRVVSPCCKVNLFHLDFRSQRSFCFMPAQPAAWCRSSLLLQISFWLAYLRPKAKACSPHTPNPLLFLCHPSGVPVVHFLVLPGLTAVSLCLDGCTYFLTIVKEALALFPQHGCRASKTAAPSIDQQRYTYKGWTPALNKHTSYKFW